MHARSGEKEDRNRQAVDSRLVTGRKIKVSMAETTETFTLSTDHNQIDENSMNKMIRIDE